MITYRKTQTQMANLKKIKNFEAALIVTHIIYRKVPPFEPLEGPYSSVINALVKIVENIFTLQIPIDSYNMPVLYGEKRREQKFFLGKLTSIPAFVKYLFDPFLTIYFVLSFCLKNKSKKKLIVAIDPLSCFPLVFLKKILGFTLIFYSVDFNLQRFKSRLLQTIYEIVDQLSSLFSDQTWVVCQSLKDFKKGKYGINSSYIPNSSIFDRSFYEKGKKFKNGHKIAWTGSLLTHRQFDILFNVLKKIQSVRPDFEFYFAPTGNHQKFSEYSQKYDLKKAKVISLYSRRKWQEFVAKCDVGIAVYDPDFGSTEFIEPLKIWDFMMCGLPFIISREPSLSNSVEKSGVAYILGSRNKITSTKSLTKFLEPKNLKSLEKKCIELAYKFDIQKQIFVALKKL